MTRKYHWKCLSCGKAGWAPDDHPECGCKDAMHEMYEDEPDPPFNEISGSDHLRNIMQEARKLK